MSQYIQEAIKNIKRTIKQRGLALNKKAQAPFTADYSPKIDESETTQIVSNITPIAFSKYVYTKYYRLI